VQTGFRRPVGLCKKSRGLPPTEEILRKLCLAPFLVLYPHDMTEFDAGEPQQKGVLQLKILLAVLFGIRPANTQFVPYARRQRWSSVAAAGIANMHDLLRSQMFSG
jgi:hypothetical protein